jgi:hypothetical protein
MIYTLEELVTITTVIVFTALFCKVIYDWTNK